MGFLYLFLRNHQNIPGLFLIYFCLNHQEINWNLEMVLKIIMVLNLNPKICVILKQPVQLA